MDRPSDSEAAYVRSVVEQLWPPAVVELHTRPPGRRRPFDGLDLVVLPSLRRPRLLIPRGRASSAALGSHRTSATGWARLKLQLVARLADLGATRLLPHVVRVIPPQGSTLAGIDDHLRCVLGRPVVVSVHIGPPRAVRKPVLQILTPTGETVAFAKVGTEPLTQRLVAREAANLARVGGSRLTVVQLPAILHHGRWNELEVLVLAALTPTRIEQVGPGLLQRAMLEVSALEGTEVLPLCDHPYLDRLHARLAALPPGADVALLAQALGTVNSVAGDVLVRFGSSHGDWSPWNMAAQDGHLMLWDWEHYESGVPAGYDALHCRVHTAVKDGANARSAYAAAYADLANLVGPFQDSGRARDATALLYAVDIALRYLQDREQEGGTELGDVANWLHEVVPSRLSALTRGARA